MQQQNSNLQSQSFSPQELNSKKKEELQAIFLDVVGEAPDESLTKAALIDKIMEKSPAEQPQPLANVPAAMPETHFFGNKDPEKRYKLPLDWKGHVVVFQCHVEQMNGGLVEVPNTHQLQTYSPAQYDALSSDAKGKTSFFSENKMKVVVLHDPRA